MFVTKQEKFPKKKVVEKSVEVGQKRNKNSVKFLNCCFPCKILRNIKKIETTSFYEFSEEHKRINQNKIQNKMFGSDCFLKS